MTIRLYFDKDSMRNALVIALCSKGMDVTTAIEAQMIGRKDEDHLPMQLSRGVFFTALIGATFTGFIPTT